MFPPGSSSRAVRRRRRQHARPRKRRARQRRANQLPRTADGKPDFSGIWQALNTAAWDIQDHTSSLASFLGVPPGRGVVEGNEIPYKPEALEQKKKNFAQRAKEDPAFVKCLLPGVPRATYMPYPFEIIQNPGMIGIRYAFARAVRTIDLTGRSRDWLKGWPDFWMGDSRGKWDGDTLVVDVQKLDERTWFDHAGNFHSEHCTSSSAIRRSTAITFSTKRRSRIRTCSRGRGRSACRSIASSTRTSKSTSGTVASIRTARKYKDAIPK